MNRAFLIGVVLALCVATDTAAQSMPEAIFSTLDAPAAANAARGITANPKGVTSRRLVGLRLDRLFTAGASRVLLNIDAHQWVATFERLDTNIRGHRAWVGSIEGIENSHVSFAERNGVVSGLINAASEIYAVQTIAPGIYTLDRVIDRTAGELEPRPAAGAAGAASAPAADDTALDDASFVDVLMLYTPGARAALGGVAQMDARIAQLISDANTIFGRSGIATRLRLVGASEAPLPETTNMSSDLDALTDNAAVANFRNTLGADLVQLLQASPSTTACGIAWVLTQNYFSNPSAFPAYSVSDISAGCVYTSIHEIGHNMGSQHDPGNASFQGAFSYGYGYQDSSNPSPFRTVMAYSCPSGCPRIANFSNPNVINSINGRVTGTPAQDNARSINDTASIVANFRQSRTTTVTVPNPPTGLRSQVNGSSVTIAWDAVTADSFPALSAATGYTIQVGTAPGVYNALPNLPVGNTTTVSGSAGPGTYYWRVIASNSAGNSAPSVEAQFTLAGCTTPGAPQNFTHSVGAGRVVTLSWSAPLTGAAPFSYIIDAGSAPGLANLLVAPVGGVTSIGVTAPPGTYFVRIRAANACAATSPVSNERVIVVP